MNHKSILLKIFISFGLLMIFLLNTDLLGMFYALSHISVKMLLIVLVLYFFSIYINSFKWFLILPQNKVIDLFKLNLLGAYYSLVLPGQLAGDLVKAYKLGKGQKDAEQVVASVFVDKVTGFIGLFIVGTVGIFFTSIDVPSSLGWILLCGVVIGVLVLLSIRIKGVYNLILKVFLMIPKKIVRLKKIIEQIIPLLEAWKVYSQKLNLIILSILIGIVFQVISVIIIYILANQIGVYLSFFELCWIHCFVSLVVLLPFTIGGLGLREGTFIGILSWQGIASKEALALSLSIFAIQIIGALVGAFFDFTMKIEKK